MVKLVPCRGVSVIIYKQDIRVAKYTLCDITSMLESGCSAALVCGLFHSVLASNYCGFYNCLLYGFCRRKSWVLPSFCVNLRANLSSMLVRKMFTYVSVDVFEASALLLGLCTLECQSLDDEVQ